MMSLDLSIVSFIFAGIFLLFLISFKWAKVLSEKRKEEFIKQQRERETDQKR